MLEELAEGFQFLVILYVEKLRDSYFQSLVIKQMFQLDGLQIDDLLGIYLSLQKFLVLQSHLLQFCLQILNLLLDVVIFSL